MAIKSFPVKLKDGRHLRFFVNTNNNLVVVDVINKGFRTGREVLRKVV